MAHPYAEKRANLVEKSRVGMYSDEAQDKKMIDKEVHAHEKNMHKGKPLTKLKSGGKVHGKAVKARSDRPRKRQFGGPLMSPAAVQNPIGQAPPPAAPQAAATVGGLEPRPAWARSNTSFSEPGWGVGARKKGGKVKRASGGKVGDEAEKYLMDDDTDDSWAQGSEPVAGKIEAADKRNYGTDKKYGRARGGKVGKTNINIIVGSPKEQAPAAMPVPPVLGPPPGGPPIVPQRPMGPPPGGPMPAMGGPPMMPPRAAGGRTYKRGGGVTLLHKPTKAQGKALDNATPVQHSGNKQDGINIGRGKPITYKTGGAINAPAKGILTPHLPSGSGGGEARMFKAKRAAKNYKKAV